MRMSQCSRMVQSALPKVRATCYMLLGFISPRIHFFGGPCKFRRARPALGIVSMRVAFMVFPLYWIASMPEASHGQPMPAYLGATPSSLHYPMLI